MIFASLITGSPSIPLDHKFQVVAGDEMWLSSVGCVATGGYESVQEHGMHEFLPDSLCGQFFSTPAWMFGYVENSLARGANMCGNPNDFVKGKVVSYCTVKATDGPIDSRKECRRLRGRWIQSTCRRIQNAMTADASHWALLPLLETQPETFCNQRRPESAIFAGDGDSNFESTIVDISHQLGYLGCCDRGEDICSLVNEDDDDEDDFGGMDYDEVVSYKVDSGDWGPTRFRTCESSIGNAVKSVTIEESHFRDRSVLRLLVDLRGPRVLFAQSGTQVASVEIQMRRQTYMRDIPLVETKAADHSLYTSGFPTFFAEYAVWENRGLGRMNSLLLVEVDASLLDDIPSTVFSQATFDVMISVADFCIFGTVRVAQ